MQADLAIFDEVKAEMAKYKKINAELVFDYEDEQGNKDARKHVKNMRKIITAFAVVHKSGKAQALAVGRLYDAEKNENTAKMEVMIAVHNDPIKRIEEREEAEKQAKIDAEIAKQEAEEVARLKDLEEREAEMARKEAEIKAKEEAVEREAREKKIAVVAADNAKKEAERVAAAESQRIKDEALAKEVEAEKVIAKAKADAEQTIKDAEEKALAEKQRLADEASQKAENEVQAKIATDKAEAKRIANKKHREKIEGDAHYAINKIVGNFDTASVILTAIKGDKIPNITINY